MKSLTIDQIIYSEQIRTKLLNFVDNWFEQDYNGLILLHEQIILLNEVHFHHFYL